MLPPALTQLAVVRATVAPFGILQTRWGSTFAHWFQVWSLDWY